MGSGVPASTVNAMAFGEINDLEASITDDVKLIRDDALFSGRAPPVVGLLYEIETGKLREIESK